jgi:hypothetical protein
MFRSGAGRARPSPTAPATVRCDRDAPRLVDREHLRLPRFGFAVPRVEVRESLSVGVANNEAARRQVGVPGRREKAGWVGHGADHVAAELVAEQRSDG